jgi:hypothetical protein
MTFDGRLQPVYLKVIKPVLEQHGYKCKRADEDSRMGIIVEHIRKEIEGASLIVCDLTFHNPNVFYELGIADTLDKTTILISQNAADLPFDVRHLRVIPYTDDKFGLLDLREKLEAHIEMELQSPKTDTHSTRNLPVASNELENQRYALFSSSIDSRRWALKFLGDNRDKQSFDRIVQLAGDLSSNTDVKRDAFTALYNIDKGKARPILIGIGLLNQRELLVRERVVELLGKYEPDDELIKQLLDQSSDTSWGVRRAICEVFGRWAHERTISQLRMMLSDLEPQVSLAAVDALSHFPEGQFGDETAAALDRNIPD